MADNITLPTTGNGTATPVVATDEIAGAHVQLFKLMDGTDGGTSRVAATAHGMKVDGSSQTNATTTGVNATTSSTEALAANANRRALFIQNISDATVYLRFSAAPVATAGSEVGIAVHSFADVSFTTHVDTRAVNVIHAGTGSKRLLITEW